MGYDMHVVDEQGENVDCPNNYWRRNIFSGSRQAEKLVMVGMAQWTPEGHPSGEEFPERPKHTLAAYEKAEAENNWEYEHPDYVAILFPYLKDRRGVSRGIAARKLCSSNDGWWVTREECKEALEAWGANGRPEVDNFGSGPLGDTIPFLQAAAEHHGFRVW